MKGGSIKLPVGERETEKRENGSIYWRACIQLLLNCDQDQWQSHNNEFWWCNHDLYQTLNTWRSEYAAPYTNVHILGNFYILYQQTQKRQSMMCTCGLFRQGWKNIGAPGTLDIGIQTIKNSWGRLFLEVIVSRVRRLKKVGGSALFVSWSGVGCP